MSYILDALRKSDQQRQQGAAPMARLAEASPQAVKPRPRWFIGLAAPALLAVGAALGGFWFGGDVSPTPAPSPVIAAPPAPVAAPEISDPVPVAVPEVPVQADRVIAPSDATPVAEAPPSIRQAVSISLHSYSDKPKERMAMINGRLLHEGEEIEPGMRLDRIAPEGVVIDSQGSRYLRRLP